PEVQVVGAVLFEHWLAIAGRDLVAADSHRLESVPDAVAALAPWSREANRVRRAGGSVWRVMGGDWQLRLSPQFQPGANTPVQLIFTERSAHVVDGRHWLLQAIYWLRHEANTDLAVALPDGATLLGVAIDDVEGPPSQPERGRLWLPLPGTAGTRRVRLRWSLAPTHERLGDPNL